MRIGLLFSGQGAQKTGMGQSLYEQNATYRAAIDHASDVLSIDLPKLYFDADQETLLNQTQYAQPAIVAMSAALYQVLQPQLDNVVAGIGLSLGEYSALACAGNVALDDALTLVKLRGELMQQASEQTASQMAAVMNTPLDLIKEACEAASTKGIVTIANVNTPKQVVIGGEVAAVEAATAYLTEHDVKRIVPLNVSGAFHTPLMQPAQAPLHEALLKTNWQDGQFPVISNTTQQPFVTADMTTTLTTQLVSTTHFATALQTLDGQLDTVIELGPGKTLTSFARKTVKGLNYCHVDSLETLEDTLKVLEGK
ncbi:ACP S-malonyltransferase [Secundilactobacillus similis]|uniref:Malonyl CoA-acyl carrier protein transacylase n=1 Tax=Secundilactobacillus similis DSM 23365 = JCM 2765 TaxID=1423804 RepID=A0A0R2F335_9LACO|nr:ACP S-malonyltransferase [Secundilactobacillus similis]KRN22898.1 [Acyl-carrier-protein] S-malonyltransferase [Secundilactobacillus similis DSM 23365 = JCM 2765]